MSDPERIIASMYDRGRGRKSTVLPPEQDPGAWPQLTLVIDSGSIGRAAANFAKNAMGANIFVVHDKFHRLVRDIKLAAERACKGVLYRAMLQMTFVWSLNQRPFGSGVWYETKREILDHFLATESPSSDHFRRFAELIAADFQMSCDTPQELDAVFERLPELPSFISKGAAPKMMRWFRKKQKYIQKEKTKNDEVVQRQ